MMFTVYSFNSLLLRKARGWCAVIMMSFNVIILLSKED